MPYLLISTQIRLGSGPTMVGDEMADPELMQTLDAQLVKPLGSNFSEYRTPLPPRQVLDKLDGMGWKVVGTAGIGQTIVWTLHKPSTPVENGIP